MRVVIIGGGIAAAYSANAIKRQEPNTEVLIVSKEAWAPYDRIHLCALLDGSCSVKQISLELEPGIKLELNCEITAIEPTKKHIVSSHAAFSYDKLIIATGSTPKTPFDISSLTNARTFRSAKDSFAIAKAIEGKEIVIVGAGPIGLELLDTLMHMPQAKKIYLLSRGPYLYAPDLSSDAVWLMKTMFEADPRVEILLNDEILQTPISGDTITQVVTRTRTIENPFVIYGIGIEPNVAFAKGAVEVKHGVLVDEVMRTSNPDIFAIGEAAELRLGGYRAGRVKESTLEADSAIAALLGHTSKKFKREITVDALKVSTFVLTDITSPFYNSKSDHNETMVLGSKNANRFDCYIFNDGKVMRFIGINSHVDVLGLKTLIKNELPIDAKALFEQRLPHAKGKMICSCEGVYEADLIELITVHAIRDFQELGEVSKAGRVCGRCKKEIVTLIEATPVDATIAQTQKEAKVKENEALALEKVKRRIEKYNTLHPTNQLSSENLHEAIKAFDMNREYNRWVSMITSSMRLSPHYEPLVDEAVGQLNKIPIIWLEMSDCTGNSEAFIKTSHPKVDDLILNYISLDYHELLMAAAGDQSETVLDEIIKNDEGEYILLVEGAIPLGMDGKYLRIGPKGETGLELLKRVAKGAKAVLSIGSCAYDGGVVAAQPNPTGAVGVAQALNRSDIINLPGCPTNPVNIVGTLLHYVMFDELPALDEKNRPKWAYSYRIHDNCERRGHYDLDEFVLEWGDEGAKQGWCLFKMGCKGPYANLNCSTVKFNEGTSWPVQAGHGCFGCGEGKIAFDLYANQRPLEDANHE